MAGRFVCRSFYAAKYKVYDGYFYLLMADKEKRCLMASLLRFDEILYERNLSLVQDINSHDEPICYVKVNVVNIDDSVDLILNELCVTGFGKVYSSKHALFDQ